MVSHSSARWVAARAGIFLLGATLFLHLLFFATHRSFVNHDAAEYLYMGRAMLEGQMPYADCADTNPPLIMYISVIPALLERVFPVHIIIIWSVLVWLILVWSTLTVRSLLARYFGERKSALTNILPVIVAVSSFCSLREDFSWVLVAGEYGQREHLFVLLCFPWMLGRWLSWEGRPLARGFALALGAAAAIGAALKPHFIPIALAPDLYWLVTRRRPRVLFRPEMVSFVAVGAAYAAHFFFLPARMKEALFSWIGPLVLNGYAVYDSPVAESLLRPSFMAMLVIASLILLAFRGREATGSESLVQPLAVVTLTALSMFALQHKNWTYHLLPAFFFFALLLAVVALDGRLPLPTPFSRQPAGRTDGMPVRESIVLAVCLAMLARAAFLLFSLPYPEESQVEQFMRTSTQRGDTVLIIDTKVNTAFPLLLTLNLRSGSRFHVAFPVPMIYRDAAVTGNHQPDYGSGVRKAENNRFLRELAEDVANRKPGFILVRDTDECYGCPPGFNLLSYLDQFGFIEAFFSPYRYSRELTHWGGSFAVFERIPPDGTGEFP